MVPPVCVNCFAWTWAHTKLLNGDNFKDFERKMMLEVGVRLPRGDKIGAET